jgi:hypothetical protein
MICFNPVLTPSTSQLDRVAQKTEAAAFAQLDPERRYWVGVVLSYCGQTKAALRLLRSAVEHNYCAYTALQANPLLVKLRGTPEFSGLLSAAKQCQNRFLAERNKTVNSKTPTPTFVLKASQGGVREAAIAGSAIMLSVTAREEALCVENVR